MTRTAGVYRTPHELARSTPEFLTKHEKEVAAKVAAKWFRDEQAKKDAEYAHRIRLASEF